MPDGHIRPRSSVYLGEGGQNGAHLENVKDYNSPCASHVLIAHPLKPAVKARFIPADHPSGAEEAHDARTGFEGAKHDGASPIFLDMGNGFDA